MNILCKPEHYSCLSFDNGDRPAVELSKYSTGERVNITVSQTVIIFIIKGKIILNYQQVSGKFLENGQIMLFAAGSHVQITPISDAEIFVMRIKKRIQLCDQYPLEKLFAQTENCEISHSQLRINKKIERYLDNLIDSVSDGLICAQYCDIKTTELFFLLITYYTIEELAKFFSPLLSPDAAFTDFVLKNYRNASSVAHLAQMSIYGLSTFKAKFRKVFGIPALAWMNEQKKRNVYHEQNCTTKNIKQISAEHHFSSVSHLTTFCKEKLGTTPGQIRRVKAQF